MVDVTVKAAIKFPWKCLSKPSDKTQNVAQQKTEDKTVCDKQNNVFKTKFITMLFTQSNLKISKSNHDLTCCLLKLFALRLGFMEVEQDFLQFILSVLEFCLKHRNL